MRGAPRENRHFVQLRGFLAVRGHERRRLLEGGVRGNERLLLQVLEAAVHVCDVLRRDRAVTHARAWLLVAGLASTSCNAVLGLEERELAGEGGITDDAQDDAAQVDVALDDDALAGDAIDDAAMVADGLPTDASQPDTYVTRGDAARSDTRPPDTSVTDSGTVNKPDSSSPDTTTADTGPFDTGAPDTGTPDTGQPDTGTPDVGPCEGGAVNACGGCSPLVGAPGGACNCGGTYSCIGVDALSCSKPRCTLGRLCCEATGQCYSSTCTLCCSEIQP